VLLLEKYHYKILGYESYNGGHTAIHSKNIRPFVIIYAMSHTCLGQLDPINTSPVLIAAPCSLVMPEIKIAAFCEQCIWKEMEENCEK
jgi:hypothetical protein